jgi:DeoR/GlpR family transcriptional regulator of sugar metabolism
MSRAIFRRIAHVHARLRSGLMISCRIEAEALEVTARTIRRDITTLCGDDRGESTTVEAAESAPDDWMEDGP